MQTRTITEADIESLKPLFYEGPDRRNLINKELNPVKEVEQRIGLIYDRDMYESKHYEDEYERYKIYASYLRKYRETIVHRLGEIDDRVLVTPNTALETEKKEFVGQTSNKLDNYIDLNIHESGLDRLDKIELLKKLEATILRFENVYGFTLPSLSTRNIMIEKPVTSDKKINIKIVGLDKGRYHEDYNSGTFSPVGSYEADRSLTYQALSQVALSLLFEFDMKVLANMQYDEFRNVFFDTFRLPTSKRAINSALGKINTFVSIEDYIDEFYQEKIEDVKDVIKKSLRCSI